MLQSNIVCALCIFVVVFGFLYAIKPTFLFNTDGSLKEFGVGYRNKTILPLWLVSILIAILSYTGAMYYDAFGVTIYT